MSDKIINFMPDCEIIYTWLESSAQPSDLITRFYSSPIEVCEREFWRHGGPEYLSYSDLTKHVFMKRQGDQVLYTDLGNESMKTSLTGPGVGVQHDTE